MANTFDFSPFERQLLKLAAESAGDAAKRAKKAAQSAYLTEAESEAHSMEGYADEALRFLNNPEGIAAESAGEDATPDEQREVVQLMFGHRAALRVGCLIRIKEAEKITEAQSEIFADSDGTEARIKDFRRLESLLRGMNSDQGELPFRTKPETPEGPDGAGAATAPAEGDGEDEGPEGPFDAPAIRAPLALSAPIELEDDEEEISDADFEILDPALEDEVDDPTVHATRQVVDDFAFDEADDARITLDQPSGDPLDEAARDAWLNEPLRTDPATPDDLLA